MIPRSLYIVPMSWPEAAAFVDEHHRHHRAPTGFKFGIGVVCGTQLVGVATVGRPTSRVIQAEGYTLEVTRVATDGWPNACSVLYASAWTAAKGLGYRRLITYTQQGESGASLRAAGFRVIAERPARPGWNMPSRPRELRGTENVQRYLWEAA